jgi:hypothetical protein
MLFTPTPSPPGPHQSCQRNIVLSFLLSTGLYWKFNITSPQLARWLHFNLSKYDSCVNKILFKFGEKTNYSYSQIIFGWRRCLTLYFKKFELTFKFQWSQRFFETIFFFLCKVTWSHFVVYIFIILLFVIFTHLLYYLLVCIV